jgi:hypothetical protein
MLPNGKIIIGHRDPRDIYASNFVREGVHVPDFEVRRHWELKLGITGAADLDVFIARQKLMYDKVCTQNDTADVLRLGFEEIVLNYEATLLRIYAFLGETAQGHIRKGRHFDPAQSAKNIGLWKRMEDQERIEAIRSALPDWCYPS